MIDGMTSRGICTVPVPGEWDWDWHGSILFVVTLYTTIGYGAFCLLYRLLPTEVTRGDSAQAFLRPKQLAAGSFPSSFRFLALECTPRVSISSFR